MDVWVVWVVGVQRFMKGEACAVLLKCIVMHCHSVIWSCFKSFLKYCNRAGLPKNDALEDDSFQVERLVSAIRFAGGPANTDFTIGCRCR